MTSAVLSPNNKAEGSLDVPLIKAQSEKGANRGRQTSTLKTSIFALEAMADDSLLEYGCVTSNTVLVCFCIAHLKAYITYRW